MYFLVNPFCPKLHKVSPRVPQYTYDHWNRFGIKRECRDPPALQCTSWLTPHAQATQSVAQGAAIHIWPLDHIWRKEREQRSTSPAVYFLVNPSCPKLHKVSLRVLQYTYDHWNRFGVKRECRDPPALQCTSWLTLSAPSYTKCRPGCRNTHMTTGTDLV